MKGSKSSSLRLFAKAQRLILAIQQLSLAKTYPAVRDIVKYAARDLVNSDGATFVLREQDQCYYVDEDAIAPLWKGKRFSIQSCISGWAMLNQETVIIPDIYLDPRIPIDAYKPTFVKSLVMVPIRKQDPIAAIGNYWSNFYQPSAEDLALLEALADSTAIAMENVKIYSELEQRVKERTEQLELANQELEAFNYSVSHDLRAPLRAINGFTQIVLKRHGDEFNEDVKANLAKIVNSANRMSELIEALLMLSKVSKTEFEYNEINLSKICQGIFQEYEDASPEQPINWEVEPGIEVLGDRHLLQILCENLLGNAIKYSSKQAEPWISVTKQDKGDGIIMKITDNGVGFSMEEAGSMFKPFHRLPSSSGFTGTGIGLAIVQRIISRHNARIWVRSELGKGTSFYCSFRKFG